MKQSRNTVKLYNNAFQPSNYFLRRTVWVKYSPTANSVYSGTEIATTLTLLLSRDYYLKRNVYKLLSLHTSYTRVGKKGVMEWLRRGLKNVIFAGRGYTGRVQSQRGRGILPFILQHLLGQISLSLSRTSYWQIVLYD
jgi:hypothetical protein